MANERAMQYIDRYSSSFRYSNIHLSELMVITADWKKIRSFMQRLIYS